MLKISFAAAAFAALVAGCAAPRHDFVKEGASAFEKQSAVAECTYQIKLNKTSPFEERKLLDLCMQGKGYRYKRVG